MRSQRWLVTTNAIWPCVSTAALERPVVPEVKKNQQGSSCSTGASGAYRAGHGGDGVGDGRLAEGALAEAPGERDARGLRRDDGRMIREMRHGTGTPWRRTTSARYDDLLGQQPEIRRHPDRAEPEGREHRPEHLGAVF